MTRIEVQLGARSYPVVIEPGLLDRLGEVLAPFARDKRLFVVSDETVWQLLRERVERSGFEVAGAIVPAGEASKSWEQLAAVTHRLLKAGIERGDHVVALGGGMVGDLAGFAAAILKRGCGWVLLPTTLLAQVDSAVGGKTGINAAGGKNLVGAFHQPAAVFIDSEVLRTLPERELRAGYAEVVKYGLIGDARFFRWCEENGAALIAGDEAARLYAIEQSVAAKAVVVAEDERDLGGRRALLNFGHSFAHALEADSAGSRGLLHGEAVALGMVLAFRLSVKRGLCAQEEAVRVERHLAAVGLPSLLEPGRGAPLARHMAKDKKQAGGRPSLILTRGIGGAFVDRSLSLAEIEDFLDRGC